MGRVNRYSIAVLAGVLTVGGLTLRTTLFAPPRIYNRTVLIDPAISPEYHPEITSLINRNYTVPLDQLCGTAQSYVPAIEKIGMRPQSRGDSTYRVVARKPCATIKTADGSYFLTTQGAVPAQFYSVSNSTLNGPLIEYPEPLDSQAMGHLLTQLRHITTQNPGDLKLTWHSPHNIDLTYHALPMRITEETPITEAWLNRCVGIAEQNPKRALRIDGRFDRMIILRGKELP